MDEEKRYWEYFKMCKDSGLSTEEAMIKAHKYIEESF